MEPISYWWTTRPYTPNAKLRGETRADVVIIGGGFTGLSTAYHLKKMDPSLDVLIVESESIGFGASGRNAGFGMTLFGLTMAITKFRFGADKTLQAHHYMERAVDYLWDLVKTHNLDCDAEHSGFLRVATTPAYAKRIQHELKIAQQLGIKDISWLNSDELRDRVKSDQFQGAWWEPRCVLLNPAKLAWEMKRVVESMGVRIVEQTPVSMVEQMSSGYRVTTPSGMVQASKIAFATNGFSAHIPQLRSMQVPAYTHIVLTEPLGKKLDELGWKGREGLEDARNLIHYFRLTKDNRLLMGGGDVSVSYGARVRPELDHNKNSFDQLEKFITQIFPSLQGHPISHRWGGPTSVTLDMAPAMGYLGKRRDAVYSLGCIGHGVSMTQYNGWTLADLLLEKKTERTDFFIVNRMVLPWPPEPIRMGLGLVIREYMRLEDKFHERGKFAEPT